MLLKCILKMFLSENTVLFNELNTFLSFCSCMNVFLFINETYKVLYILYISMYFLKYFLFFNIPAQFISLVWIFIVWTGLWLTNYPMSYCTMPEHCSIEIPEHGNVMTVQIIVALCSLEGVFIFSGIINQTKHSRWNITKDNNNSVSLHQSALSLSAKPLAK